MLIKLMKFIKSDRESRRFKHIITHMLQLFSIFHFRWEVCFILQHWYLDDLDILHEIKLVIYLLDIFFINFKLIFFDLIFDDYTICIVWLNCLFNYCNSDRAVKCYWVSWWMLIFKVLIVSDQNRQVTQIYTADEIRFQRATS